MKYNVKELKRPKDTVILVDVDDVIEDLNGEWIRWLNTRYNLNVKPEDIDDWDFSKYFPTLTREQVFEPLDIDVFWMSVMPFKDALYYLNLLRKDGYQIYLCTSSNYKTLATKYKCIIEHWFKIDWKNVIVTHRKQLIKADYLIDDWVNNLIGGDFQKLLFTRPYNKNYDAEANKMIRVNNWSEIYNVITRGEK